MAPETEIKHGKECKSSRIIYTDKIIISLGETTFKEVQVAARKI